MLGSPGADTDLEFACKILMRNQHLREGEGSRTRQREKWNFNPGSTEPQPQDVLWVIYDLSELQSIETK